MEETPVEPDIKRKCYGKGKELTMGWNWDESLISWDIS